MDVGTVWVTEDLKNKILLKENYTLREKFLFNLKPQDYRFLNI